MMNGNLIWFTYLNRGCLTLFEPEDGCPVIIPPDPESSDVQQPIIDDYDKWLIGSIFNDWNDEQCKYFYSMQCGNCSIK